MFVKSIANDGWQTRDMSPVYEGDMRSFQYSGPSPFGRPPRKRHSFFEDLSLPVGDIKG